MAHRPNINAADVISGNVYAGQEQLRMRLTYEAQLFNTDPTSDRSKAFAALIASVAAFADVSTLPAGSVAVATGDSVTVTDADNQPQVSATVAVTGSTVKATLPATSAVLNNGDAVPISNASGTTGATFPITVQAGAPVRLTIPNDRALVGTTTYTIPVTGTYTTKATLQITNGTLAGIVLS